jgi:hypothetical protein
MESLDREDFRGTWWKQNERLVTLTLENEQQNQSAAGNEMNR